MGYGMKVLLYILIFYFIIPVSTHCLAISHSQNLQINVNISAKSKIAIDRTEIPLSNDPQVNTSMLSDFINISSETKTGRASETSLETAAELVSKNGDSIPLKKTSSTFSGAMAKISWKRSDSSPFQGDIWDALIENVSYQNNTTGPYVPILKYTLITP
jgi:hypothetical protein